LDAVVRNKGAPGIDGITVKQLPGILKVRWPEIEVIAQRRAIDALRRQRLRLREVYAPIAYENYADDRRGPDALTLALGDTAWLTAAVQGLPVRQREAVNLLVFQSRSFAGAANAAGRSAGSLRVSWHRALRTLQAQLGRQEE
jgi:RNA polymerase sigma-70 factor (ECF subfamily)